jgi:hypothetical protein
MANCFNESLVVLPSRRIVNIHHFFASIKELNDHKPFGCSFNDIYVIFEKRDGLKSRIGLKCRMCNIIRSISTEESGQDKSFMDVNTAVVTGILASGGGHSQLEQVISTLDIPCTSFKCYKKHHDATCDAWETTAHAEMESAVKDEAELAVVRGEVDDDGTPLLAVIADGSWCKRSYRTNYNSSSGLVSYVFQNFIGHGESQYAQACYLFLKLFFQGAIVGYYMKKLIFLGVKNRYCIICTRSASQNLEPRNHVCFKNWGNSQSSTSMEAAVIVDGFLKK